MSFLTLVVQTDPNTMLGYLAGANIQSNPSTGDGTGNAVFGYNAALALTTGARNTIVGNAAGISLTTGVDNVLLGNGAGGLLSGGAQANVAIGNVGTGGRNAVLQSVAVGAQALAAQNGTLGAQRNTALGASAGASIIQGEYNTVLGYGAGALITSGSKNSILGSYSGNQGGLDIRTLSNYIVLSDGDGNPRLWIDNTGAASIPGGILSPTISGSLTITGGTVTASNPVLQATQTWNNAGVTFTGWRLNITNTASAVGSRLLDLQIGGITAFNIQTISNGNLMQLNSTGGLVDIQATGNTVAIATTGAVNHDVLLPGARFQRSGVGFGVAIGSSNVNFAPILFGAGQEANYTIAQRNGVNAQTFNIYNTYTDASNYERGFMRWSANILEIGREFAGTGLNRDVRIRSQFLYINVNNNDVFTFGSSTHTSSANIVFAPDNTYDIGASGANRPRNLFLAGNITTNGGITIAAAGYFIWPGRASFDAAATDIVRLSGASTGGALQLAEMTAPSAPATDNVRIYAEDNGAGKTRLMARFATGAAVQIAIEP